jgi:hypothetical protein
MTNQQWKITAAVLGVVFAILAGSALAIALTPGSPAATGEPSLPASGIGLGSSSLEPSIASDSPLPSAEASRSESPSTSPSPTPKPARKASLTFLGLKLDASDAPSSHNRTISFTSNGAGTVTVKLATRSAQGTTHLCVTGGSSVLGCRDWTNGTFTAQALTGNVTWIVALKGEGVDTPIVDVTVSFPATKPSVKITHARFDGTSFPETNGIAVRFAPRGAGAAKLVAKWGSHNFVYDVELSNATSGTGDVSRPNQTPATSTTMAFDVTAKDTWRLEVHNAETGFGVTELTATISWP